MTERRELGRDELRGLLAELGARLARRRVKVDLFVVGGAAMALAYHRERVTVDVDVMLPPPAVRGVLGEVVGEMADEFDLPADWLNPSATAWTPPLDKGWATGGESLGGLNLVPASPQILLAMKLLADRERDFWDLVHLVRHLDLHDAAAVVAVFRDVYPDGPPAREPEDAELLITAQEAVDVAWGGQ